MNEMGNFQRRCMSSGRFKKGPEMGNEKSDYSAGLLVFSVFALSWLVMIFLREEGITIRMPLFGHSLAAGSLLQLPCGGRCCTKTL